MASKKKKKDSVVVPFISTSPEVTPFFFFFLESLNTSAAAFQPIHLSLVGIDPKVGCFSQVLIIQKNNGGTVSKPATLQTVTFLPAGDADSTLITKMGTLMDGPRSYWPAVYGARSRQLF